jgi:hypothetical protein
MASLSGWTQWTVAYFSRLFFMNQEIVFDFPSRIKFPKLANSAKDRNLAGTSVHQAFWLGGDAPINLTPMRFDIDFQPDSEDELKLIERFVSLVSFRPQSFCPLIWIEDVWYIPTGGTTWQTSRNLAYDILDYNDPTNDYKPKAYIDGVLQEIITAGDPIDGQVKITIDAESGLITTPVLAAGEFLYFHYPAKFYIDMASIDSEIPDTDDYTVALSLEEHLLTRAYNFSIP